MCACHRVVLPKRSFCQNQRLVGGELAKVRAAEILEEAHAVDGDFLDLQIGGDKTTKKNVSVYQEVCAGGGGFFPPPPTSLMALPHPGSELYA